MSKDLTDEIIKIEFDMFDKVNNEGGRASCQDDFKTFEIMRGSQFDAWSQEMRESYLNDLKKALEDGRNLVMEKYAYMTGYSYMGEEDDIIEKETLLMKIMSRMHDKTIEMRQKYPNISKHSRPVATNTQNGTVGVDQYLLCELMTYSVETLRRYNAYLEELEKDGKSLPLMTLENTMERYGFKDLDEAEAKMV